jgi:eukaryotic-like serine/threonine-protein kinase
MTDLPGGWRAEAVMAGRPDRVVMRARRPGGSPVVVKATPPGAGWITRAALRREARVLESVRSDGVIALHGAIDRRGRTALVLDFVPAGSLADRPAVPDPDGLVTELTATVERLHRLGVAHGALRPEHVLVDADGHPVLCGFGSAHRTPDPDVDAHALTQLIRTIRSGA